MKFINSMVLIALLSGISPMAVSQDKAGGAALPDKAGKAAMLAAKLYKVQGDKLVRQGRYKQAERAYLAGIKAAPNYAIIYNELGNCYFAQKKYYKAIDMFRIAAIKRKNYAMAIYNLAFILRKMKRYKESGDNYRRYIKLKHADPDAHLGLAQTRLQLGDLKGALTAYQGYLAKERRPAMREVLRQIKAKVKQLKRKLAMPVAVKRAPVVESKRAPAPVMKASKRLVRLPKADKSAAKIKARVKAPILKIGVVKAPAEIVPSKSMGLIAQGDRKFKFRNYKQAREAYYWAVRKDPKNPEAYYKLGVVYSVLGNYQRAIQAWQRVLILQPHDRDARQNIEAAYNKLGFTSNKKLKLLHQKPDAHLERVKGLLDKGLPMQALRQVEHLLLIRPKNYRGVLIQARALMLLGRIDASNRAFRRALRLNPGSPLPYYHIGMNYRRLGKVRKAKYMMKLYLSMAAPLNGRQRDNIRAARLFIGQKP